MRRSRKVLAIMVVFALLVLVGAGTAAAATGIGSVAKGSLYQTFISQLAANLGIDQAKVEQALKQAAVETVDEAVKQGIIPQDRASKLKEAIESGKLPPFGCMVGRGGFGPGKGAGPLHDELASVLGMTAEELHNAIRSGKTLEEIAASKGFTLDQVKEQLIAKVKAVLDEKVAQGQLTGDQAQQILFRLQQVDLSKIGRFVTKQFGPKAGGMGKSWGRAWPPQQQGQ
ncbi:hypothetical protein SAMN00808754_1409 [Thermanaeromonas toyohensis ToBE]|uniref:DUF2680 domain-containing protein n=1 Tax=Thermanaeromonas toyohensis ToBE TaxID=698762 RepID=A0A1W1VTD2_9FIRM|nr:hypothetical protein [Thermanaeromonas toyohensis]SMB96144.1 hypothetical protein SAMN00808754_1409 [Thermanaeromonas toyohensis ToBE]